MTPARFQKTKISPFIGITKHFVFLQAFLGVQQLLTHIFKENEYKVSSIAGSLFSGSPSLCVLKLFRVTSWIKIMFPLCAKVHSNAIETLIKHNI